MENIPKRKEKQIDMFLENDPYLKDAYEKASFRISILGGEISRDTAYNLGKILTGNFYSIQTGGYNSGTMSGALKGADKAIQEMKKLPSYSKYKEVIDQINPYPKGIVASQYAPEYAEKGENIKIDYEDGDYGLFMRLAKLTQDSSATIILSGESGTELETLANLHFDKKFKKLVGVESKPLIFWRDSLNDFLNNNNYIDIVNKSNNIFRVETEGEMIELINALKDLKRDDISDEDMDKIKKIINFYQYKF